MFNNNKNHNDPLVYKLKLGGKLTDKEQMALGQVLKGDDKARIARVLDALESRAKKAKHGNNDILNAMSMYGISSFNQFKKK